MLYIYFIYLHQPKYILFSLSNVAKTKVLDIYTVFIIFKVNLFNFEFLYLYFYLVTVCELNHLIYDLDIKLELMNTTSLLI